MAGTAGSATVDIVELAGLIKAARRARIPAGLAVEAVLVEAIGQHCLREYGVDITGAGRQVVEHGTHDQRSHGKRGGGGGGGDGDATAPGLGKPAGGRRPKGRRQYVDRDAGVAIVKVRGGKYVVVGKTNAGKEFVQARGLTRDEAMGIANQMAGPGKDAPAVQADVGLKGVGGPAGRLAPPGPAPWKDFEPGPLRGAMTTPDNLGVSDARVAQRGDTKVLVKSHMTMEEFEETFGDPYTAPDVFAVPGFGAVAASNVDQALGLGVVPPTKFIDAPGVFETQGDEGRAVAQSYVDGLRAGAAEDLVGSKAFREAQKQPFASGLVQAAYLDAIMGNMDRHLGNAGVVPGSPPRVVAIDNDLPLEYSEGVRLGVGAIGFLGALMGPGGAVERGRVKVADLEKFGKSLPDIPWKEWKRMTLLGGAEDTYEGVSFARGSYWRYQQTRKTGLPVSPANWRAPLDWDPDATEGG